MRNALMLIAAGVLLTAMVIGVGNFVIDNLPPCPTSRTGSNGRPVDALRTED